MNCDLIRIFLGAYFMVTLVCTEIRGENGALIKLEKGTPENVCQESVLNISIECSVTETVKNHFQEKSDCVRSVSSHYNRYNRVSPSHVYLKADTKISEKTEITDRNLLDFVFVVTGFNFTESPALSCHYETENCGNYNSEPLSLSGKVYQCDVSLKPEIISANEGDKANMDCKYQLPTVWKKDGILWPGSTSETTDAGQKRTIWNVAIEDTGLYTCTSFFEPTHQGIVKNFFLFVSAKPLSPENLTVVNSTNTSLILTWDLPEIQNPYLCRKPSYFHIRYQVLGETTALEHNSTSTNFTIGELKPNTVYKIQVSANNALGKSNSEAVTIASTNPALDDDENLSGGMLRQLQSPCTNGS